MNNGIKTILVIVAVVAAAGLFCFEMNLETRKQERIAGLVPAIMLTKTEKQGYDVALQDATRNGQFSKAMEAWLEKIDKAHPEGGRLPAIPRRTCRPKRVDEAGTMDVLMPAR